MGGGMDMHLLGFLVLIGYILYMAPGRHWVCNLGVSPGNRWARFVITIHMEYGVMDDDAI